MIDGELSDDAWRSAEEIAGFTQMDSEPGKPAVLQTRVRVVYDDDAIYFSAVMESTTVNPLLARRDTDLNNGDYIRIDSQPGPFPKRKTCSPRKR